MRGGNNVGARRVDLGVNGEGRGVDGPGSFEHGARVVDKDKVSNADLFEAHTERIDPEAIRMLRVAGGDMTRNSFVKTELAEDTKRCC